MPPEQTLVHFGGAIKALDDSGRVGGYLVTFSDAKRKDLDGDYFDAKSYLGARDGDGVDCLFHHGLPLRSGLEQFADHIFKPVKTTRDEIGVFAETVLDLADAYEAKVHELAKAGKIGWSSGSASHTVKRREDGYLKQWLIVEASLTPTPAQPFVNKIMPLKTAANLIASLEPIKADVTIKGMFDAALDGEDVSQWLLWDTYGAVVGKLATVKATTAATGVQFDLPAKLDEATGEYVARLKTAVLAQIEDYVRTNSDEPFTLKSFHNPKANPIGNLSGVDLDDHLQLLVSGLRGLAARLRDNHEARIKVGRTLSEKNRQRIASLQAQLAEVNAALQDLLDASTPMASDEEKRAAISQALRLRARTRQLGVVTNG